MIFVAWLLIFVSLFECSRINFKILKSRFSTSAASSSSKQSSKKSVPKPKTFNFHFDISLSSMLTGVALTTAAYHHFENQNLECKLMRSRLLLGEIKATEIEVEKFNLRDEKFFFDAVEWRRQDLCLLLLKRGAVKPRFISDSGDNLLVTIIENEMDQVLNFLMSNSLIATDLRIAIDLMDERSGKTPLLAAIQAKMYPQARRLLEMGAKPMIPSTTKYPARNVQDFIDLIEDDIEGQDLLKDFSKLFKSK